MGKNRQQIVPLKSAMNMKTVELKNLSLVIGDALKKPTLINQLSELDDKTWDKIPVGTYITFAKIDEMPDYDKTKHPFDHSGFIEVRRIGGVTSQQVLFDYTSHIFTRYNNPNEKTWYPWVKIK